MNQTRLCAQLGVSANYISDLKSHCEAGRKKVFINIHGDGTLTCHALVPIPSRKVGAA